jgi:hypothetical protein
LSSVGRGFKGWNFENLVGQAGEKGRGRTPDRESPAGGPESGKEDDLFQRSEELGRVEEEARKAGFEAGYAEGLERARSDMEPLRQAWLDWASKISAFESDRLRALLPVLVDLQEKALSKILGDEEGRPRILRKLLERMVGEYASGREGELLVPESDFHLVRQFDPGFPEELAARGIRLGIAPDLPPRHVELRFSDRIVAFDPASAGDSLRKTLSRADPGPIPEIAGPDGEVERP